MIRLFSLMIRSGTGNVHKNSIALTSWARSFDEALSYAYHQCIALMRRRLCHSEEVSGIAILRVFQNNSHSPQLSHLFQSIPAAPNRRRPGRRQHIVCEWIHSTAIALINRLCGRTSSACQFSRLSHYSPNPEWPTDTNTSKAASLMHFPYLVLVCNSSAWLTLQPEGPRWNARRLLLLGTFRSPL